MKELAVQSKAAYQPDESRRLKANHGGCKVSLLKRMEEPAVRNLVEERFERQYLYVQEFSNMTRRANEGVRH